jgi:SpoIID/LytB domain protein
MKRKFLPIYILVSSVLLAGCLFAFFQWWIPSPQEKTAEQFLSALSEGRDISRYLSSDLLEQPAHPFLGFFQREAVLSFEIERLEPIDKEHTKVWISIFFPAGKVRTALDMVKSNQVWIVAGLPETSSHTHGIPITKIPDEKNRVIWEIDTGGQIVKAQAMPSMEILAGQPVRFYTLDGFLADIQPLQPVKLTRVMSLSNTVLEDRDLGYFEIQGDFPVFLKKGGQFTFSGYLSIPVGAIGATLYRTPDNRGRMAVLSDEEPLKLDKIRVILQNSEYSSLLHPQIRITCQKDFTVESVPNGIRLQFQGGETAEFRPSGKETVVYKNGQAIGTSIFRWYIIPQSDEPLYVRTIHRSHTASSGRGTPYRGTLEAAVLNEQLTLVNEVNLEEYLCSVVPSEMPVKFGLEALKVQAVAARSYAARAIQASGYRPYGAHLDDSTASQVYNNNGEQEIAVQAVQETSGAVAAYSGEIVDTRFFSTSCGYTANFHEVWSSKKNEFPSAEVPYLKAVPQYDGNTPDLYHEENFRAFLDQTDLPGYDRFSPFFRWTVKMTRAQLEASLNQNLPSLYRQQPLFVMTRASDGTYQSMDIPSDIGSLLNIEVLKRGEGGNIMELAVATSRGIFKIVKEYNIRLVLKPVNTLRGGNPMELQCYDGTTRKDFPLLPSSFAYIKFERDTEGNIQDIIIKGGGYGHGVGMSQYGTYGLTLLGKTWKDIIGHYYPGSELIQLYE